MRRSATAFGELRRDAGPFLLLVFLAATQLGPAVHLARHRDDHTHGLDARLAARAAHDAAHRAGRPHRHPTGHPGTNAPSGAPDPTAGTPAPPDPSNEPAPDHGRLAFAHFGVALIDGPPPPIVLRPAGALTPLPGTVPRAPAAPRLPPPPSRGPPDTFRTAATFA